MKKEEVIHNILTKASNEWQKMGWDVDHPFNFIIKETADPDIYNVEITNYIWEEHINEIKNYIYNYLEDNYAWNHDEETYSEIVEEEEELPLQEDKWSVFKFQVNFKTKNIKYEPDFILKGTFKCNTFSSYKHDEFGDDILIESVDKQYSFPLSELEENIWKVEYDDFGALITKSFQEYFDK